MGFEETILHQNSWDSDLRLSEMKLDRKGLLVARDVAVQEASNATSFHPANAAGTLSYQHGTWALRDQFVGDIWVEDRSDGIEAIVCEALKIKVAFCNVDLACNDDQHPQPRSRKGAGAERASGGFLFPDLPQYAPRPTGDYALYYLMVDESGAAELSRPALRGGKFVGMIERIYLSSGRDEDGALITSGDNTGPADNFDPQVVRK